MTEPVETLYSGRFLRLVKKSGWEYVERSNSYAVVGIVAITAENKLLLVEQHRVPVGTPVIELPAGLVGDTQEDDDLVSAARRELLEETGYQAEDLSLFNIGPSSAGLCSELIHIFHATNLTREHAGGGVEDENITVHEVSMDNLENWLNQKRKDGFLIDSKIYLAAYLYLTRK